MDFSLKRETLIVLELLRNEGAEAFVVGGYLRDFFIKKQGSDADIATSALPEQVSEIFSNYKIENRGAAYGTIVVWVDQIPVEITTFRIDGIYTDGRRPDSVCFTKNIKEDLERRDFTMNAMAYSPQTGLIDLFGGREDIEKKQIRCVGDPEKRFGEDGLRILRALRFASSLSFTIEKETSAALWEQRGQLSKISKERVWEEMKQLLVGKNAEAVMEVYEGVLEATLPCVLPEMRILKRWMRKQTKEVCLRLCNEKKDTIYEGIYLAAREFASEENFKQ